MTSLAEAADYLRRRGIAHPESDVRLLAARAAGRPLRTALGSPFPALEGAALEEFRRLLERRGRDRVPAAYLVGTEEFMGLEFRVTPAVLIPRPSTETLAERALAAPPGRFLEIGTGCGALAVVLARSGWTGVATDLSAEALEVARENAGRHGVAGCIAFVRADLFAEGTFDLVVSNPPYVASGEFSALPPEVLHEPRLALDGGPDGLEVIRRVAAGSRRRAPRLLLECAPRQAAAVRALVLGSGFRTAAVFRDLDGFDRVVEALA